MAVRLFKQECYKYFVNRNALVLIFILMAVQGIITVSNLSPLNFVTEWEKETYLPYLEIFGGKIDDEKLEKLEMEKNKLAFAQKEVDEVFVKLQRGEITPAEYSMITLDASETLKNWAAFSQIQNQFDYAIKDKEHRYILYENGWDSIMLSQNIDFAFILGIILLTSQLFCPEYETGMNQLISCTKNGKRKTMLSKLFISVLVIIPSAVISSVIALISAQIKYGLDNPKFPIQSLKSFEVCPYDISILQAYVLMWTLKIISLFVVFSVTALVCVLIKKSVNSLFISATALILPLFVLPNSTMYYMPHLGLNMAEIFFKGIAVFDSETDSLIQKPIERENLIITIIIATFLIMICVLFTCSIWHNRLKRSKK